MKKEASMKTCSIKQISRFITVVTFVICFTSQAYAGSTARASVATEGVQWSNTSDAGVMSADGRYVAFHSYGSNPFLNSIYVHDRQNGTTEIVSLSSQGVQANGNCINPSLSADGRYVAFISYATNLIPGDTNGQPDVFVRDLQTGITERVSVSSSGEQANGGATSLTISADGRYVAFSSYANNLVPGDTNGPGDAGLDVFIHDRITGATERVSVSNDGSQGNNGSSNPVVSAEGRFVAFVSNATNLVAGDTNGMSDVFLRDRQTLATERISLSNSGGEGNGASYNPAMSGDARFFAFLSTATNLVPADTNNAWDVFVRDRVTGSTERVNVSSSGVQANYSTFNRPAISNDGRRIVFDSWATNLVENDANGFIADIFLHDRQSGITELVSVSSAGVQGNGSSYRPSLTPDGSFVVFSSWATNLVSGDTNGKYDVFVRSLDQ